MEETLPELKCIMNFPALDRIFDSQWEMELHGWMKAVNTIKCLAEDVVLLLCWLQLSRNYYQFCCIKWRKTLWKNHLAEKPQLCIEFWISLVGNLGQKKVFFQSFGLLACSFWLVSHNLYRISTYTPRPNQNQQVAVSVLGVSLADAYSSGDGISKASSDKGHSYCSMQSPCCHKAGIVIPFICLHSPDKCHACRCVLVPQPVLPLGDQALVRDSKHKPSGFAFLGAGNLFPVLPVASWSSADRGVGLESSCADNSHLQPL